METKNQQKMALWSFVKELVISRILIITVFFASVAMICILEGILWLTVRPWNRRLYRKIDYILCSNMAYTFPVFVLHWWSETTFELIVDPSIASNKLGKEHAILLPNHRFDTDWLLMFPYASHFDVVGNLRICTKKSVQYLPLVGWSWKLHENPFLERNWEKDKNTFGGRISDLLLNSDPGMLVLFAEGTRYTKDKHEESMIVARQKGFQELKHHLLPRTRGFLECIKVLKRPTHSNVPVGVYDALITVESATGDEKTPISVMSALSGKPSRVKLLLRRYSIRDIPDDEDERANWLRERFQEKDKLLDNFFKTGNLFDGENERETFKDFQSIPIPRQKWILKNFLVYFVLVVGLMLGFVGASIWTSGISGKAMLFPVLLIIGYLGLSGLNSAQNIENCSSYGLKLK